MKAIALILLIFSWLNCLSGDSDYAEIYRNISPKNNKPSLESFEKAMIGFDKLKQEHTLNNPNIITIIDLSLPSTKKRLWIINLKEKRIIENSLVAHGRNTGNLYAEKFSNTIGSKQSSLGYYITGGTYHGNHGLSLYLNGVEPGINDKAKERLIVMHGAPYVSQDFIHEYGRLGRSFGCPAVPVSKHRTIINTIKNGSCLFIYHPSKNYMEHSQFITSDGD